MNFRRKIAVSLLLCTALCVAVFAQVVHIPDPKLRAVVSDAIGDNPITQLTRLGSVGGNPRIRDLEGLQHAANLEWLEIRGNHISDLTPLANLDKLRVLILIDNRITNVEPLRGLTNLRDLYIENNFIVDHSPLDQLTLDNFTYDQTCDVLPEPLEPRLKNRSFASIFASFNTKIVNKWDALLASHDSYWDARIAEGAHHDIFFSNGPIFSDQFRRIDGEWHMRGHMPSAIERRDHYHSLNPNMVFICEIKYRGGVRFINFENPDVQDIAERWEAVWGPRIDFTHPEIQDIIVSQALAIERCGLYDGIFFDWWNDYISTVGDLATVEEAQRARDNIVRRIREKARPDFLIVGNTNDRIIPLTGEYMNGAYMEGAAGGGPEDWRQARNSLQWLETNLREPRTVMLQGATDIHEPPDSPYNQRLMRATTTMSLTHSDGYVQFPIGTSDEKYWYEFWDTDLGQPVGPKFQLYENIKRLYIREFTNGWAVYNHSGEPQVITLPEEVQGVASGSVNTEHELPNLDGEMYLKAVVSDQSPVTSKNPADVNGDGAVNILDLVLVAQGFGKDGLQGDVNGDGVVNVFDLVFVANQF